LETRRSKRKYAVIKQTSIRAGAAILLTLLLFASLLQGADRRDDIVKILTGLQNYHYGDDPSKVRALEQIVREIAREPESSRQLEGEILRILASDQTSLPAKGLLSRQLSVVGSDQSLPTLRSMLMMEQTAELACMAVRGILTEQATLMLHEVMEQAGETTQVGIINLLGERGERASVPVLIGRISGNSSEAVLLSAAAALGKIGTEAAAKALGDARRRSSAALRPQLTQAYLQCAQTLARQGKPAVARQIYGELAAKQEPLVVRRAALVGTIELGGQEALAEVSKVLKGADLQLKSVAISESVRLKGTEVTRQLISAMGHLEPWHQALLLEALVERGDDSLVRPVIVQALEAEASVVREAAIRSMAGIGDASSVGLLVKIAEQGHPSQQAALFALGRISGPGIEAALLESLARTGPQLRPALIRITEIRGFTEAIPFLKVQALSKETESAVASLRALGALAGPSELPALLQILMQCQDRALARSAEAAVVSVARKVRPEQRPAEAVIALLARQSEPAVRSSLIRVLAGIGGERSLTVIEQSAGDADAEVRDTAIREIADWKNAEALPALADLLAGSPEAVHRILLLRGFTRLLQLPARRSPEETLRWYRKGLESVATVEEKRLVLSGLAAVPSPGALALVHPFLQDETVRDEAQVALDRIIGRIEAQSLFDGKTLEGWEGDLDIFTVEDGTIVAGSLEQNNPRSGYLRTRTSARDFELRVTAKLAGPGDNGGVQFRSRYDEGSKRMSGYQADMGSLRGDQPINLWGCLYDEGRRNKLLVIADQEKLTRVFKPGDWNNMVIRAIGKRIQVWVNGERVTDYVEEDDSIWQEGIFALQVHGGPPCKVWYKDIWLKKLE
jgi:HEAT repeat protein